MIINRHNQVQLMKQLHNAIELGKEIDLQLVNDEVYIKDVKHNNRQDEMVNLLANIFFNKPMNWLTLREERDLLNMITIAFRQLNDHYFKKVGEFKKPRI